MRQNHLYLREAAGQILKKSLKMKQQETINQMVKNVIKVSSILGVILFVGLFSNEGFTQVRTELCEEEHKIIETSFKKSTEESIQIYFQTIGYESWMNLF